MINSLLLENTFTLQLNEGIDVKKTIEKIKEAIKKVKDFIKNTAMKVFSKIKLLFQKVFQKLTDSTILKLDYDVSQVGIELGKSLNELKYGMQILPKIKDEKSAKETFEAFEKAKLSCREVDKIVQEGKKVKTNVKSLKVIFNHVCRCEKEVHGFYKVLDALFAKVNANRDKGSDMAFDGIVKILNEGKTAIMGFLTLSTSLATGLGTAIRHFGTKQDKKDYRDE